MPKYFTAEVFNYLTNSGAVLSVWIVRTPILEEG